MKLYRLKGLEMGEMPAPRWGTCYRPPTRTPVGFCLIVSDLTARLNLKAQRLQAEPTEIGIGSKSFAVVRLGQAARSLLFPRVPTLNRSE
jgi:hypothetical protein